MQKRKIGNVTGMHTHYVNLFFIISTDWFISMREKTMWINQWLYRWFYIVSDFWRLYAKDCLPPDTTVISPWFLIEEDTLQSYIDTKEKCKQWIDDYISRNPKKSKYVSRRSDNMTTCDSCSQSYHIDELRYNTNWPTICEHCRG